MISSFCNFGDCVDVRLDEDGLVQVSRSDAQDGVVLSFTREEWTVFLAGVKAGEFTREALGGDA